MARYKARGLREFRQPCLTSRHVEYPRIAKVHACKWRKVGLGEAAGRGSVGKEGCGNAYSQLGENGLGKYEDLLDSEMEVGM